MSDFLPPKQVLPCGKHSKGSGDNSRDKISQNTLSSLLGSPWLSWVSSTPSAEQRTTHSTLQAAVWPLAARQPLAEAEARVALAAAVLAAVAAEVAAAEALAAARPVAVGAAAVLVAAADRADPVAPVAVWAHPPRPWVANSKAISSPANLLLSVAILFCCDSPSSEFSDFKL